MTEFKFTDTKQKNVLKKEEDKEVKPPKMGRPKVKASRTNKIICYFSDEEFLEIQGILDGRPASSYLRQIILDAIRQK